ncbi:response regulator [Lyngbya aestuarii]|uniref:response regulator n=1 Tax=Lyngbya aestuarii TaxID=118322 RepID=UPI00403E31BC
MNQFQTNQNQGNILVIDDTPANLRLLVNLLTEKGYKVRPLPSGKLALSGVHLSPPDLILLDILMPEMDGYEVCQRLKANPLTRDIPVIFISAINDLADKVKAFSVGGVDYITKPFQAEEVLARVKTHIDNRYLQKQLQEKNQHLAKTLKQLQATQNQLIQSEKMVALGQLVAGIAHEVNTPLGAIRASSSNISNALEQSLEQLPKLFTIISEERQADFFNLLYKSLRSDPLVTFKEKRQFKQVLIAKLQTINVNNPRNTADTLVDLGIYEDIEEFLPLLKESNSDLILQLTYDLVRLKSNNQNIITAIEKASKVVFALKSYARYDQSGAKTLAIVTEGIETVLTLYHNHIKQGIELLRDYEQLPPILCYPDELNQVWTNLIHNAIQAMNNQGQLDIKVYAEVSGDGSLTDKFLVVSITDNGCGIPAEIQPRIFEPFFTTKNPGEGSGLGLDISKKIIDKHQGKIEVKSKPGRTTFRVYLPIIRTAN